MGILTDGRDLPTEVLAEEIVKLVLAEPFINKKALQPKINAVLKAFISRIKNAPRKLGGKVTEDKKANYIMSIRKRDVEVLYWKREFKKIIGEDGMAIHYKNLKDELIKSNCE